MSIWKWSDRYTPPLAESMQLSLEEGRSPCLLSKSIGPSVGLSNLYFKVESGNPTGSYKDRFAASAISHMMAAGQHTCLATSSGNTGAALAAYCAVARIRCRIAVVEDAPLGKLQQMSAYGADVLRVNQFGLDAKVTERVFNELQNASHKPGFALQISAYRYSPLGMQGVESIGFELHEQLSGGPSNVFCPAGGGGLTLAVARGFQKVGNQSAVHCVQPEGNNTIAGPLRDGDHLARQVQSLTKISGLQVASVIDGNEVIDACRRSRGTGHLVSDRSVYEAQKRLSREEGIFCEPAGAVALAGVLQATKTGELDRDARVVCLVTGSGFKDPASIECMNADEVVPVVRPDQVHQVGD